MTNRTYNIDNINVTARPSFLAVAKQRQAMSATELERLITAEEKVLDIACPGGYEDMLTNHTIEEIYANDWLNILTHRNGRDVLVYFDEDEWFGAVYMDNLEEISEDEYEFEFC